MMTPREAYKAGYAQIEWKPIVHEERPQGVAPARSSLPCPMMITDTMDPVEHVDGKFYTSKSAFRAVTKAHGYVEVGDDPARNKRPPPPKPDRKAIKEAVAKAVAQHTT